MILYSFIVYCYITIIRFNQSFNSKAKEWYVGRIKQNNILSASDDQKHLWFHCASLGEFEQAREIIEKLRDAYPQVFISLSFFSPSGYEIRKNYAQVDQVLYMPGDMPKRMKHFINQLKPDVCIFIKNEFWANTLDLLNKKEIPYLFVSSNFKPNHFGFLLKKGAYFKKAQQIFLSEKNFIKDYQAKGLSNIVYNGDTRIDRVLHIANQAISLPIIREFKNDSKLIIIGSAYPVEIKHAISILQHYDFKDYKLLVAPHEIKTKHIATVEKTLQDYDTIRYSALTEGSIKDSRVLILDTIGQLSAAYKYADIAIIGGGFGKGIHNILEPSSFGLPIFFGPNHQKFREAIELINLGAAFQFNNAEELIGQLQAICTKEKLTDIGKKNKSYLDLHRGASLNVFQYLEQNFLE